MSAFKLTCRILYFRLSGIFCQPFANASFSGSVGEIRVHVSANNRIGVLAEMLQWGSAGFSVVQA